MLIAAGNFCLSHMVCQSFFVPDAGIVFHRQSRLPCSTLAFPTRHVTQPLPPLDSPTRPCTHAPHPVHPCVPPMSGGNRRVSGDGPHLGRVQPGAQEERPHRREVEGLPSLGDAGRRCREEGGCRHGYHQHLNISPDSHSHTYLPGR